MKKSVINTIELIKSRRSIMPRQYNSIPIEDKDINLILKISGLWVQENNFGLTFRFLINRQL